MTNEAGYWRCAKCDLLHVFRDGPQGRQCDHCGWGEFNAGKESVHAAKEHRDRAAAAPAKKEDKCP
jgi:predicted  nucleic acid-binding Zn-ribbon protein